MSKKDRQLQHRPACDGRKERQEGMRCGFPAASVLGSVILSVLTMPVAAQGVYVNDGNGTTCTHYSEDGVVTQETGAACSPADKATQRTRALFYNPGGTTGANSLSLGGELFVNSGQLGLGITNGSMRIGALATLNAVAGARAIAMGNGNVATTASGSDAIALGTGAFAGGTNALAFGSYANATASNSIAVGWGAQTGSLENITIGRQSGQNMGATSTNNVVVGSQSGQFVTGAGNATFGSFAGTQVTGSNNLSTGFSSGRNVVGSGNTALGAYAGQNVDNNATPDDAAGAGNNVAVGYYGGTDVKGAGNIGIGSSGGRFVTGSSNLAIGENAGTQVSGTSNLALGTRAGVGVTGGQNISLGSGAGASPTGQMNESISIGASAGSRMTNAVENVGIGASANLLLNGGYNVGLGATALFRGVTTGSVAVGYMSGLRVNGDENTMLGIYSGNGMSGNNNVAIGSQANGTDETSPANPFTVNNTVTIGNASRTRGDNAIAIGNGASAEGVSSIAIGTGNVVTGAGSGAIGDPNTVSGAGSYALGNDNTIAQDNTFVVGNDVAATQANSVVLGNGATDRAATGVTSATVGGITYGGFAGVGAPANGVVSVGSAGAERQVIHVAAGAVSAASTDAVNGSQLFATQSVIGNAARSTATMLGGGATLGADGTLTAPAYAIGGATYNNVGDALAAVDGGLASQDAVTSMLGTSTASGLGGASSYDAATGQLTTALQVGGTTYGTVNEALSAVDGAIDAASVGWGVTANGAGSTTANIGPGGVVGFNGDGNVTVTQQGSADNGQVNVALNRSLDLDGVTIGNTVMSTTGLAVGNAVTLGATGLLLAGGPSVTVAGINAGGLRLTNLGAGTAPTDAVTLSQLQAAVAGSGGGGSVAYVGVNSSGGENVAGEGASGTDAIAIGKDAEAAGASSLALGASSTASEANSVALGAGSTTTAAVATTGTTLNGQSFAYAGVAPAGVVSVGSAGAERQIQHVAAGQVSATSTDAVNGSQLNATNQAVEAVDGRVSAIEGDITDLQGSYTEIQGDITDLQGDVASLGQRISNVETVVNEAAEYGERIDQIENGQGGMFRVAAGDAAQAPEASGAHSVAGGSGAVASGENSTAIGDGAVASGDNSTAIGQGAQATHDNSVALGQGSATTVGAQADYDAAYVGASTSTGEVNIGGRTLTGVAPGIAGTDAVNVNQLTTGVNQAVSQANAYTDGQVRDLRNDMWTMDRGYRAATASAMAMAGLPQAYLPGKSMLAVGFGGYQSEYGMAVGLSGITPDGRWVYKAQAGGNTSRDWGFSMGAGIQW